MEKFELEKIYYDLRDEINNKWTRTLPFSDMIVDRWEKAKYLGFGENSSIYDSGIVIGHVVVGEGTWIGPNTLLDGSGGRLEIGYGCDISAGVHIYTHDTVKRCISGGKLPSENGSVIIGDYCYIAPMSIISRGVSIGKHSVIAAHSFVNQSFEEYSIIAGIPAKKIGRVIIENDDVKLEYFKD